jgi:hypothetical protein
MRGHAVSLALFERDGGGGEIWHDADDEPVKIGLPALKYRSFRTSVMSSPLTHSLSLKGCCRPERCWLGVSGYHPLHRHGEGGWERFPYRSVREKGIRLTKSEGDHLGVRGLHRRCVSRWTSRGWCSTYIV